MERSGAAGGAELKPARGTKARPHISSRARDIGLRSGQSGLGQSVWRGRERIPCGEKTMAIKLKKSKYGWLKNGNPTGDLSQAKPCGAKTRKGTPCKAPAMPNGRCRMHGGASTGPKTPEGRERSRRARWKHGKYSADTRWLNTLSPEALYNVIRARWLSSLSPEARARALRMPAANSARDQLKQTPPPKSP